MATATTKERGIKSPDAAPIVLRWNTTDFHVERLDRFTFLVHSQELARTHAQAASPATHSGEIVSGDAKIIVQFRIRSVDHDRVLCGFFDLPIAALDRLSALAESPRTPSTNALNRLSYDELAEGGTGRRLPAVPPSFKSASTVKKAIVSAMLGLSMLIIVGWVLMVVRSQAAITIANSVMIGNYQPINTPLEGKLLSLQVAAGDQVQAGQVLATVANPAVEQELGLVEAKLTRALQDLEAYRRQGKETESLLVVARQTLETKRLAATAVRSRIQGDLKAAEAQLKRAERLVSNRLNRMGEYELAVAARDRWAAELESQSAVLAGIGLALQVAAKDVIVDDGRITNPMSEIRTKIALAEALVEELQAAREAAAAKAKLGALLAPSAGTVFAIYRRPGETLKLAEEALAINRTGESWAMGHIPAAYASKVKPGHSVEIEIPSLGISTKGVVEGIGYRAVHGRGGYTADFRGGPLDVPVRVAISAPDAPIPSGLRLNMTVRVRDYLKEIREWVWSRPTTDFASSAARAGGASNGAPGAGATPETTPPRALAAGTPAARQPLRRSRPLPSAGRQASHRRRRPTAR